jgi:DNA integrity scanning protein DisA with diadenylate cyclase activity
MFVIKIYHLLLNNNFLIKNFSKDTKIKNFNNNFMALFKNFSKDIAIKNFNNHFMTLIKILINHYLHISQIFKLYNFIIIITYFHIWINCKHY